MHGIYHGKKISIIDVKDVGPCISKEDAMTLFPSEAHPTIERCLSAVAEEGEGSEHIDGSLLLWLAFQVGDEELVMDIGEIGAYQFLPLCIEMYKELVNKRAAANRKKKD
jgi:hypothetical protein